MASANFSRVMRFLSRSPAPAVFLKYRLPYRNIHVKYPWKTYILRLHDRAPVIHHRGGGGKGNRDGARVGGARALHEGGEESGRRRAAVRALLGRRRAESERTRAFRAVPRREEGGHRRREPHVWRSA